MYYALRDWITACGFIFIVLALLWADYRIRQLKSRVSYYRLLVRLCEQERSK